MKSKRISLALLLAALPLAQSAHAQQPAYTFQALGDLGGGSSYAYAINSSGQVVGDSTTAVGSDHPFLYSNGVMKDLGTLGGVLGAQYPQGDYGYANALSDNGQVTGYTYKEVLNPDQQSSHSVEVGFRYSNGMLTEFDSGSTLGINNAGQSVGYNNAGDASLYSNGVDIDLGLESGSRANAINNQGQIVGRAGGYGAYLYQNGGAQSLGSPQGFLGSGANAISSNGLVAGIAYTPDGTLAGLTHAALWSNGQSLDLGTLGGKNSTAYGVNSAGAVIGVSDLPNTTSELQSAFIYKNGTMYDLETGSGWLDTKAEGINDAGQVVGDGFYNGEFQAFIATPNATPAPGSLLTFTVGIGVMGFVVRRRKRAV